MGIASVTQVTAIMHKLLDLPARAMPLLAGGLHHLCNV